MTQKVIRVGIVAGEASGDTLAAGLIAAFKRRHPNAVFEGIAGPKMQSVGCASLFDMEELSVMGLVEVLPRIRRLLFIRKQLVQYFADNPPDVFVGVDAPGFNLGLETKLKQRGIKTVHYVSPTIWAWRENRVHKIARATHSVFCIFPFEPAVYDKYQMTSEFVGHTLADQIPLSVDRKRAREFLSVETGRKVLAMLPGSRAGEVKALLDIFLQSAALLHKKTPGLLVLIPVVNKQRKSEIESKLRDFGPEFEVRTVFGHSQEVMIAADAVLLASGTAALEAALCKRPMVVAYRLKPMTYQMMRFLYKQKYFSLPNILADKKLVPELLQKEVNPELISEHLLQQMEGEHKEMMVEFTAIHQTLKQDADSKAAQALERVIETGNSQC